MPSEQESTRVYQLTSMVLGASLTALVGAVYFALEGNPMAGIFGAIGVLGLATLVPRGNNDD